MASVIVSIPKSSSTEHSPLLPSSPVSSLKTSYTIPILQPASLNWSKEIITTEESPHNEVVGYQEEEFEERKKEVFEPELEALLTTNPLSGLSYAQVQERLVKFGYNEIQEGKESIILKFLGYFNGPIAWLIEAAVILAAVVKDWLDFGIILALLIVNAIIGFVEERKAESALDALRQTLALKSKAYRSGNLEEVNSRELVPGDIIILRLGDIVPADCRLLGIGGTGEATGELQIDQAALTGESLPVHKDKGELAYSSSIIKQGQQLAVVVKTGEKTFIGKAANLIAITNEPGHFQKVIQRVGNFLIGITLALVTILLVILLTVKQMDVLKAINYVLVLTIASIPVGLPTVLSVTMAVGAKQLAKKQVIVKRLPAVEEMAGISILCSDKTGTLTLNHLSLVSPPPLLLPPFSSSDLLFNAFLASEAGANDAIELACRTGATMQIPHLVGSNVLATTVKGHKVTYFKPFDPVSKLTEATVVHNDSNAVFKVAKGAPQVIIRLCGGDREASEVVQEFGKRGMRCLGVARNNGEGWMLVGLLAFLDPPRPDSKQTIEETRQMGVSVKMITGDQLVIAKEVSHRLGLPRTILPASKLNDPTVSIEELTNRCVKADGFAQVVPEDKFRVVELLQKRGLLVGMTGDGVNDAPALKKANVGIAVHGCTDAARSAADVVLLAPGLSSIVDGIKTSRAIFQRMRSYALYRITSTIHFLLFFFFSIIFLNFSLPAELIVLICLLNDAATLVIAVGPDKWRLGQLLVLSFILALILSGASFAHFFIGRDVFHLTTSQLHSIIYLQVSSCPHFLIFGTRVQRSFWTNRPSLAFFGAIVGTQILAMFVAIYGLFSEPVGWVLGLGVMGTSVVVFCIMDIVKPTVVYKYWSFEMTATLCPTPKRRAKLHRLEAERSRKIIVDGVIAKIRKVILIQSVLIRWKRFSKQPLFTPPSLSSYHFPSSSSTLLHSSVPSSALLHLSSSVNSCDEPSYLSHHRTPLIMV